MRTQVRPGTYQARIAGEPLDDVVGGQPVLKFYFDLDGAEGDCDAWICWCDSMYNQKGEPSANLKGLRALGVTDQDLQSWARTGTLKLREVDVQVVVEENKNGYSYVKYVNEPGRMRPVQRLDARQRQSVAAKMLQAIKSGGATPAAPTPTPGTGAGTPGDDDIPF